MIVDHVLLRLGVEQVQLGVVHQSRENKQLAEYLAVGHYHSFVLLAGYTDCLARGNVPQYSPSSWLVGSGHNKYGSVQEWRSTFGHIKAFKILGG